MRILAHIPGEVVVPIHKRYLAQNAPNDSQSLGVRVATRRHKEVLICQCCCDCQQADGAHQGEGKHPGVATCLVGSIRATVSGLTSVLALVLRFANAGAGSSCRCWRLQRGGRFGIEGDASDIAANYNAAARQRAAKDFGFLYAGNFAAGVAVGDGVLAGEGAAYVRVFRYVWQPAKAGCLQGEERKVSLLLLLLLPCSPNSVWEVASLKVRQSFPLILYVDFAL